jgi:hypothetical protein
MAELAKLSIMSGSQHEASSPKHFAQKKSQICSTVPGRPVLFPLYTPHVTEPSGARICLAFEIVPFDRNEQRWAEAERVRSR